MVLLDLNIGFNNQHRKRDGSPGVGDERPVARIKVDLPTFNLLHQYRVACSVVSADGLLAVAARFNTTEEPSYSHDRRDGAPPRFRVAASSGYSSTLRIVATE